MDLKQRFQQAYPDAFFLENDLSAVQQYLQEQGWLEATKKLMKLEIPGAGNMNYVLRVITEDGSFILKQARPWVEKFPQIDAPVERIEVETQFYQILEEVPTITAYMPKCIGFDEANFILAMEDLGKGIDYSFLYHGESINAEDSKDLTRYLSVLHQLTPPRNFSDNTAMKSLNHEHIFNFPYQEENGFNLDEVQAGLQAAAMPYKKNTVLKEKIKTCGEIYLSKGEHLLHGDFYPGSWLKVEDGLKVIDPEFGFVGPAEFDMGVLIAHLTLAEQNPSMLRNILTQYKPSKYFSNSLLARFAGVEMLRRLIGIAQLPLILRVPEKEKLMKRAAKWILFEQLDI